MNRRSFLGLALLATLASVGCGGSGLAGAKGKVTLDGQPVTGGQVSFVSSEGAGDAGVGVLIQNGEYDLPSERGAAPGKYRVEIHWYKPTGKTTVDELGDEVQETEEAIPAKYNTQSELTADLQAGDNELDFDLKS